MVFIARDGTIHKQQPWGWGKIMSIFSGFIDLVVAFFQTMIPIEDSPSSGSRFGNSGGGQGGGSGGSSGGNSRPPRPPRPGSNIHGFGPASSAPPPSCGSCCGM